MLRLVGRFSRNALNTDCFLLPVRSPFNTYLGPLFERAIHSPIDPWPRLRPGTALVRHLLRSALASLRRSHTLALVRIVTRPTGPSSIHASQPCSRDLLPIASFQLSAPPWSVRSCMWSLNLNICAPI